MRGLTRTGFPVAPALVTPPPWGAQSLRAVQPVDRSDRLSERGGRKAADALLTRSSQSARALRTAAPPMATAIRSIATL